MTAREPSCKARGVVSAIGNERELNRSYVIGHSFRTAGTMNPEDMGAAIAARDVIEFPELAAIPDNLRTRSSIERFGLCLQTVLDGVERRFLDQPG